MKKLDDYGFKKGKSINWKKKFGYAEAEKVYEKLKKQGLNPSEIADKLKDSHQVLMVVGWLTSQNRTDESCQMISLSFRNKEKVKKLNGENKKYGYDTKNQHRSLKKRPIKYKKRGKSAKNMHLRNSNKVDTLQT